MSESEYDGVRGYFVVRCIDILWPFSWALAQWRLIANGCLWHGVDMMLGSGT